MNVAFIVPNCNSYISDFTKIKVWVVQVVVRSDPANPHSTGLLSGKYSDWIIILVEWKEGCSLQHCRATMHYFNEILQAWNRSLVREKLSNFIHTVVVFEIISASSRSSGTTSSIRRGTVGVTGGGVNAAFFALEKNLEMKDILSFLNQKTRLQLKSRIYLLSPSLFTLLCGCVLLIFTLVVARKLFRDRRLFFFLILLLTSGWFLQELKLRFGIYLKSLILRDSEGSGEGWSSHWHLEGFVKFYGHAESKEQKVCVGVLRSKCPMSQFQTGGAIHCSINTGNLLKQLK